VCAGAAQAPRLSVAMIVRDEAPRLPGFLENVLPLADEVCVVDTGSTDGTAAMAAEAGCRVGRFAWCDDFAAARNASLALCRGAWVLVLDADERIDPADRETLRQLVARGAPEEVCYRLITRNYTNASGLSDFVASPPDDAHARGYAGWFPSGKVRLFPNLPGACFEGRVHELVNASLEGVGCRVLTSPVPVHHYPLDRPEAEVTAKRAFYLRLARERAAECPGDAHAQAVLAEQCVEAGDGAEAMRAYGDALRLAPANAGWMAELGAVLLLLGRGAEARRALELALRLDEARPAAWRNLGVLHAREGRWPGARDCFERAVALDGANGEALRGLALALRETGDVAGARSAAARAVAANPHCAQAQALVRELAGEGQEGR